VRTIVAEPDGAVDCADAGEAQRSAPHSAVIAQAALASSPSILQPLVISRRFASGPTERGGTTEARRVVGPVRANQSDHAGHADSSFAWLKRAGNLFHRRGTARFHQNLPLVS